MKRFVYDEVIDRENFCNMKNDISEVLRLIEDKRNVVIYGPRNYGKTSLMKSMVIPEFRASHKDAFIVFMDLYDMKDEKSLNAIMQRDFERAFASTFPAKELLKKASQFLQRFTPQFSIDPLTGQATLAMTSATNESRKLSMDDIFDLIITIGNSYKVLLVIDEFQAISRVDKLDALFRAKFQIMNNIPIVLMGSQKHMLLDLFSRPSAPLADFGNDIELKPIEYSIYHKYIEERFNDIVITPEMTTLIQERMNRVPESINILAHNVYLYALDNGIEKIENEEIINIVTNSILSRRRSKFENMLYSLTKNEENLLIEVARVGALKAPGSSKFLARVQVSASGAKKIVAKLLDLGYLDRSEEGFIVANPLLKLYLKLYR